MAETVVLEAKTRSEHGTRVARRLRKQGLVPAVVYGHKEATVQVTVPGEELLRAIRHGSRIIELKQAEKSETALIREVQWDPFGHDILHVDFARVAANETVTLPVPIIVRGTAPGIAAGGVLVQPVHTLTVECLVFRIPDAIRINVGELQLDQAIHISDLKLPEGVVVKGDPETIVVQVVPKEVEPEAALAAGEAAEPEVIGRKEKEEEAKEE
jgi:large subunit ribosomal protein L25